jgi:myo-inositol 2-dehydrogenase / D-chiro-inositol 1-dehydrogenase
MTQSDSISFGVVGCGRIGRMHARNIDRHPRARLAACFDVVDAAASQVAAELRCRVASSVDEILADGSIDAIFIASSTGTHVDLIERGVKARKAVLCEKPIDLDIKRVDACWREIAPLEPLVMIGFNRRFDPSFRSLQQRAAAGTIGRVEQVIITSRDPSPPPATYVASSGGLFRDMTIHDFDMARYLAGDIVEVTAVGANLIDAAIGKANDIDAAMIVLRAASGALVHINNSRRCAYGYDQRLEVFGENGMLQAANRHLTTVESWTATGTHVHDPVQDFFIARYHEAYVAEIDHFVECVTERKKPLADFHDGREALRIADAAMASMRSGKTVALAA